MYIREGEMKSLMFGPHLALFSRNSKIITQRLNLKWLPNYFKLLIVIYIDINYIGILFIHTNVARGGPDQPPKVLTRKI